MKTPKISVIMSVYNGNVQHLREAIDSILNQTFSDFEFIIINDGSTDLAVAETIKSYDDKRIKYFYKPNGGISNAKNYALDRASGEYVAIMDADDISLPQRFAMQVKFLDENPDFSLVGARIKMFGDTDKIVRYPEWPKYFDVMRENPFAHPVVMMRRADIEKFGFRYKPEYIVAHDYDLWGRMIRIFKMANIPVVLLNYRRMGQGITTTKALICKQENEAVKSAMVNFLSSDEDMQRVIKDVLKEVPKKPKIKKYGITLIKIKETQLYKKYYLFGFIQLLSIERICD